MLALTSRRGAGSRLASRRCAGSAASAISNAASWPKPSPTDSSFAVHAGHGVEVVSLDTRWD
jgi:hypothetical protein